ncbi:MAG: hypothetical protein HRF48_09930, partial [Chloroflexota bacterium]
MVLVAGVLLLSVQGGPIGSWFAISNPYLSFDLHDANIAYNNQQQEYLVVWWGNSDSDSVWGQRVSHNGTLVGAPITTAGGTVGDQRFPDVAYNSLHHEYLVVWDNQDATDWSIRARRIAANGWLPGEVFTVASGSITETYCTYPAVAYASTADRYLVIYEYGNRYGWLQYGIAARAFTSDGTPEGPAFDVRPYGGGFPLSGLDLAYNRARNEFLVVWSEGVDATYAILGRRVKMNGGAGTLGDIFTIANTPAHDDVYPAVAALPFPAGVGQYLVTWQYVFSLSDSDILAQRVAGDASGPIGALIGIAGSAEDQGAPAVDGDETSQRYLVTWSQASAAPLMFVGIRGRAVSAAGELLGQEEGIGGVFADHAAL